MHRLSPAYMEIEPCYLCMAHIDSAQKYAYIVSIALYWRGFYNRMPWINTTSTCNNYEVIMAEINIQDMNFEAALSELESLVQNLESGQTSLEDSIDAYERGVALKKHCEKKLKEAELKIEKIAQNEDGSITTTPFSAEK
jgi:exodeoxyribonuclease VII small subunit